MFFVIDAFLIRHRHTLAKSAWAFRPKGGQRTISFLARSCLVTLA
jgi:hypothetical protein